MYKIKLEFTLYFILAKKNIFFLSILLSVGKLNTFFVSEIKVSNRIQQTSRYEQTNKRPLKANKSFH